MSTDTSDRRLSCKKILRRLWRDCGAGFRPSTTSCVAKASPCHSTAPSRMPRTPPMPPMPPTPLMAHCRRWMTVLRNCWRLLAVVAVRVSAARNPALGLRPCHARVVATDLHSRRRSCHCRWTAYATRLCSCRCRWTAQALLARLCSCHPTRLVVALTPALPRVPAPALMAVAQRIWSMLRNLMPTGVTTLGWAPLRIPRSNPRHRHMGFPIPMYRQRQSLLKQ